MKYKNSKNDKNERIQQTGKIIKRYRVSHHFTQEQLGELVGCSPGFIGQIERGECMPSISVLYDIIHELDIDANDLFWSSAEPSFNDQQLTNQIMHYVSRLDQKEKEFILSVISHMDILR